MFEEDRKISLRLTSKYIVLYIQCESNAPGKLGKDFLSVTDVKEIQLNTVKKKLKKKRNPRPIW